MRAVVVVSVIVAGLLSLSCAGPAAAQNAGAKGTPRPDGITKEQYVAQAKERAAKRFDKLDANHDGVLTAEERRAARQKRRSAKSE